MNKKNKLLYSLGSISSLSFPLVVVSANTQSVEKPDDVPLTPDPDFYTFKDEANKQIANSIEKSIDVIIGFIKDNLNKLKNDNKTDYKIVLSQTIYFNKLLTFFESNKQKIISDPDKYGFFITFPYAISREKKLGKGNVEFNGKKFENIVFGLSEDSKTNYERAIDKKSIKKDNENENTVQKNIFQNTIKKYTKTFLSEVKNIVFNNSDILVVDKDFNLEYIKDSDGSASSALSIQIPKGFKTWDEYFIKKITPRFIEFDLKQNQEFIPQEIKKPKSPETPPQLPPLIPGKPALPTNPAITNASLDALPSLVPLLRSDYSSFSYEDLVEEINLKKRDIFFFNNPINTRYVYNVEQIYDNKTAKISISERKKPELKRIYTIGFNLENNRNSFVQKIFYEQISAIEETARKFYNAIGLDENLDYTKIRNSNLQNIVFGMVDQFIKLIYSPEFLQKQNESINYWISKMNNINDTYTIKNAKHDIINLFLSSVTSSSFNSEHNWNAIAQIYDSFLSNDYPEYFKFNNKTILKNFELMNSNYKQKTNHTSNYDISVIDRFVDLISKNVYKTKALSNPTTFNLEKWYNSFTKQLGKVNTQFQYLSILSDSKTINEDTYKNYSDAYEKAVEFINEQKASVNEFKKNFGIVLSVIGTIIFLLNIILISLNFKTLKQRKLRTLYIILILVGLVIISVGAGLVFLGMKGI
ncbi:MSC_0620 family F1-like ATPase-associated subunit [Mycoplasma zalophidermidis]|uniref:MSC_0620 family F1-like ATPase-associated subunit n=1 Tax=Mycoplasma zalophidermidis TaxID=398174 RepID=UPI00215D29FB|nr:hypothetical protein [Mycoplasma zalophidermidis]MCR8966369.1 hypothetical protein [Mycoplasma zalophidermidis]